jgi:hypothetical protein
MLAKKVYELMRRKDKGEQRGGIPTLQELAKEVVAENFERYPKLQGPAQEMKKEVSAFVTRTDHRDDSAGGADPDCGGAYRRRGVLAEGLSLDLREGVAPQRAWRVPQAGVSRNPPGRAAREAASIGLERP